VFDFATFTVLHWFFFVIGAVAFGFEAWALGDAVSRPATAFVAAGKLTKQKWLYILGAASAVGLTLVLVGAGAVSILGVAAFVAAAVYLTDVKPKVKDFPKNGRGGSSTSYGPYGPW